MRTKVLLGAVAAAALVLSACGGGSTSGESPPEGEGSAGGVRTIEITALDELRFEPDRVEVAAGETVRFVVTNAGSAPHEFVVGDETVQMQHEGQMTDGMDHGAMADELPALSLDPGETVEATVTFEEPGELLYGCHVPGHYAGGMVGTIVVS